MKLADFWEVFSRIPCFGKFSVTSHTRLSTTPHHTTLCGGTENGLKVSSSKQRKTGQVSTPSISRCPPKHSVLLNRHIFSPPVTVYTQVPHTHLSPVLHLHLHLHLHLVCAGVVALCAPASFISVATSMLFHYE